MLSFVRSLCFGTVFVIVLTACGNGEDSSVEADTRAQGQTTSSNMTAVSNTESAVCDADADGKVDRLDIRLIVDARNTTSSGADDPRDADGNGSINVLDARNCVLQCTNPHCEVEAPDSQSKCAGDCFPNGVAAGDVDQSSAVLWTRTSFVDKGTVRFEYGRDKDFILTPDGFEDVDVTNSNIPAKIEITELLAGTQYYYRVCRDSCPPVFAGESEARGAFRTPHASGNHGLRFGVSSCWRDDLKPFVSIRNVPDRNLDFFVALGDTVYADSPISSPRAKTRDEFREKNKNGYSQMYSPDDNMFALARASTAFYADIDDHDVINNFAGGAKPRSQIDTTECSSWGVCFCDPDNTADANCDKPFINETDLFKDALQAWHEYNPIREELYGDTGDARTRLKSKLYRHRTFGKDAATFMLDTRSFRDEPSILNAYDQNRTMLGKVQLEDLKRDLLRAENNGITWKFVLVPEPIQHLGIDPITTADRFEGYAHERDIILDYVETNCIANTVFISGDIHANVVNNLTYTKITPIPQYLSTAWDISAGPVAYDPPLGAMITGWVPGEPIRDSETQFRNLMDTKLLLEKRPRTGLDPEVLPFPLPLQAKNVPIPARLLQGAYVAGHSFGWTEFEIHPQTQKLTVTTWGVNAYQQPVKPKKKFDADEVDALLKLEPEILQRFEVLPRNGCPACGDGICNASLPLLEQCGGDDTTLLQCKSDCGRCGNGDLCADDGMCESNLCNLGICTSPLANDLPCARDKGCISGICSAGFCTSPKSNGKICLRDKECQSGLCDLGLCTAPNSKERFSPCGKDAACKSRNCTPAKICGL